MSIFFFKFLAFRHRTASPANQHHNTSRKRPINTAYLHPPHRVSERPGKGIQHVEIAIESGAELPTRSSARPPQLPALSSQITVAPMDARRSRDDPVPRGLRGRSFEERRPV